MDSPANVSDVHINPQAGRICLGYAEMATDEAWLLEPLSGPVHEIARAGAALCGDLPLGDARTAQFKPWFRAPVPDPRAAYGRKRQLGMRMWVAGVVAGF